VTERKIELENDPENPCFGCGPNNLAGLQLKFYSEGGTIKAEKVFDERYSAWPGQLHGGIAFAALECTCQWTFYTHKGHSGPTARFSVDFPSRVLLHEPVTMVGRVVKEQTHNVVSVRAEMIQSRVVRVWMEQDIIVISSAEEFSGLRPAVRMDDVMKRNLESF
jgi:acyl-coenzyme A thioesterase PaaI-like protein